MSRVREEEFCRLADYKLENCKQPYFNEEIICLRERRINGLLRGWFVRKFQE